MKITRGDAYLQNDDGTAREPIVPAGDVKVLFHNIDITKRCYSASDTEGRIELYVFDEQGRFVTEGDMIKIITNHGKVRFQHVNGDLL